jgi:hypothetical protein
VAKSTSNKNLCDVVLERYRLIFQTLHPIVCSAFDNDATTRSQKLSFDHIEYAADVKSAVIFAFKGRRNRIELENAMDVIVASDETVRATVSPSIEAEIIRLCSPVFAKRGLDPASYFRKIRRGSQRRAS